MVRGFAGLEAWNCGLREGRKGEVRALEGWCWSGLSRSESFVKVMVDRS